MEKYLNLIKEHIHDIMQLTKMSDRLYTAPCILEKEKSHPMYYNVQDGTFSCPYCGYRGKNLVTLCCEATHTEPWPMLERILRLKLHMNTRSLLVEQEKERFRNELLYEINYHAMLFFEEHLWQNPNALKYLKKRGLKEETIRKFNLGYAPKYNKLYRHLQKDFRTEELELAGIIGIDEKSGRAYDMFKDRIIFPIIDNDNQILGFGGRAMGNNPRKYINTKTTPIFQKSNHLYAFNMMDLEKRPKRILVCEGYMDVIALHQENIAWAVGTLGTALTRNHYQLLLQYTDKPTVIFDGDDAGMNAANRTLERVGRMDILTLPDNLDPDEYIQAYGKNRFLDYVEKETLTWEEYWLSQYRELQKEKKTENIFRFFLEKSAALKDAI